jgi:hypothetical protein
MITVNSLMRRARRRLAFATLFAALALAVAAHDSAFVMDHDAPGVVAAVCLAVAVVGVAVALAPGRPTLALAHPAPSPPEAPAQRVAANPMMPPSRAGPSQLQVFLN